MLSGRLGIIHKLEFYGQSVEFDDNIGIGKSGQVVTRLSQHISDNKTINSIMTIGSTQSVYKLILQKETRLCRAKGLHFKEL